MSKARLQAELAERKAEVQWLRDRMPLGTLTVHKDLSLITIVPRWTGSETEINLQEFFSGIERPVRIGRWEGNDNDQIATVKMAG